jgi:hypothetical protein
MIGSLLRLAMLAGTGAGMAAGFRHAMLKLAALFAAALVVGLIVAGAIGYFGVAVYFALAPEFGAAWAAAGAGLMLIGIAAILGAICGALYLGRRRRRAATAAAAGIGAGLGGPLGAAALGASMGSGTGFDLKGALGRNAMTVLLTAFIAGMVMNNRK